MKHDMNLILNEIDVIVSWYQKLNDDFTGINDLINYRRKLATWYFYFNTALGESRNAKALSEAQYNEERSDKMAYELSVDKKMNHAEVKANSSVSYMLKQLEQDRATYYQLKDIQNSIVEVLNSMQQHIAVLRIEMDVNA